MNYFDTKKYNVLSDGKTHLRLIPDLLRAGQLRVTRSDGSYDISSPDRAITQLADVMPLLLSECIKEWLNIPLLHADNLLKFLYAVIQVCPLTDIQKRDDFAPPYDNIGPLISKWTGSDDSYVILSVNKTDAGVGFVRSDLLLRDYPEYVRQPIISAAKDNSVTFSVNGDGSPTPLPVDCKYLKSENDTFCLVCKLDVFHFGSIRRMCESLKMSENSYLSLAMNVVLSMVFICKNRSQAWFNSAAKDNSESGLLFHVGKPEIARIGVSQEILKHSAVIPELWLKMEGTTICYSAELEDLLGYKKRVGKKTGHVTAGDKGKDESELNERDVQQLLQQWGVEGDIYHSLPGSANGSSVTEYLSGTPSQADDISKFALAVAGIIGVMGISQTSSGDNKSKSGLKNAGRSSLSRTTLSSNPVSATPTNLQHHEDTSKRDIEYDNGISDDEFLKRYL